MKIVWIIFCFLISLPSFSRNEIRLIIKSTEGGKLKELITQQGYALSEVDCLTIGGPINTQDIRTVVVEMEQLREFDLRNTTVVAGKYTYYPDDEREQSSRAETLSFGLDASGAIVTGDSIIPKNSKK